MFWPLILPFQLTAGGIVAAILLAVAIAPRFGKKRSRTFAWGILLGTIAFVPSCTAVMVLADAFRFGVFHFPDFESVDDFRVERFLPEPATDITVDKYASGFQARFTIDKKRLDEWFTEYWDRYGQYSVIDFEDCAFGEPLHELESATALGGLDWNPSGSLLKYEGPSASNGAGFTIWYCEADNTAYQQGGYW